MDAADGSAATDTENPEQAALRRALALQIELTTIVARGGGIDRLLSGWQQQTSEPAAVFDRLAHVLGRNGAFPPELLTTVAFECQGAPLVVRLIKKREQEHAA